MLYALLIYGDETQMERMTPAEREQNFGAYMDFTKGIVDGGQYRGGEALQSIRTATTVRVKEGKVLTTDGPFAETREQLGGFYLIEASDLDEAIAIAAKIPATTHGSVEVRPIMPT